MALEPKDILTLADALGRDRFALLGHSQGARVAVHVALQAPDRVSHLLLLGPPHDGVAERLPRTAMQTLARAGRLEAMHALWLADPMMATRNDDARRLRDRIVADYAGRDLLDPQGPLPLDDAHARRLAVPLTVLVGSADTPARAAAARRIVGAVEGARLVVLDEAGHLANMEAPNAFNAALADALGACPIA